MKFSIPKIIRPISLTDYAPEMVDPDTQEPVRVLVWVNPPNALLKEYDALLERAREMGLQLEKTMSDDELRALAQEMSANGRRLSEWYAEIWSQGKDPATHWSAEDVLSMATSDTEPALHGWLRNKTQELIVRHREGEQKK